MSSSFIHVVACVRVSFLRLNGIPLYIFTFCLSIHLLMDTWLALLLTIVNKATVNTGVQVSVQVLAFTSLW